MQERKAPREKSTSDPASETWNRLPWRKLEKHCFRIQKRIYQARQRGNTRAVHKLQKLLLKSEAARLLAVRRVTQENQGKKTAGIDGVKSVKPQARFVMASHLHPKHWRQQTPKPVRRVWIPKPGKAERRPLGIPPMIERCKQALVKLALEPEWEAKFEANSYGFRPGRSCHDAKEAIFTAIKGKPKFVFDADIKGAFDHIKQEALLEKLHTYPTLRKAIKGWLKAGVMEGCTYAPTEVGTPQGGVISPLLMNVALHGMEILLSEGYSKSHMVEKPRLIRYADDFVIFHSQLEELQKVSEKVTRRLEDLGLTLSSKKTRITLKDLNPIIWGWAAYYKTAQASRTFKRCDHVLWEQLMSWARARHRNKGTRWIVDKYWHRVGKRKWVFATPNDAELRMHSKTHIQRYPKVKGRASPYDGNTLYWSQRLKTHPLMHETKARLLQRQQGKCRWCALYFKDGDILEIDHLDRDRNNNDLSNKMLLHRHCHDERHAKWMAAEKLHKLASAGVYIK